MNINQIHTTLMFEEYQTLDLNQIPIITSMFEEYYMCVWKCHLCIILHIYVTYYNL